MYRYGLAVAGRVMTVGTDSIIFPHLGITLAHVGRGIRIGSFEIAYYGIIIALGMVSAVYLAMFLAKRTHQSEDEYFNFALLAILLSVIGARIYYVVFLWEYYRLHPAEILNLRGGGLAIYGGILTALAVAALWCRRKKKPLLLFLDTALPALAWGQAVGRWGNFFNREAFGGYTDNLLAMRLPLAAVRSDEVTERMREHLVTIGEISFIQVHPTFLYESVWNLTLVLIMAAVMLGTKKWLKKRFDGQIACIYLTGYGLGRFWIEGLRTDQLLLTGTQLPVSQLLSVVMMAAGVILYIRIRRAGGTNI